MAKTTTTKPETNTDMDKLRQDVHSLQKHLSELRNDVTAAGRIKATEWKSKAQDNVSYLQDYGRDQYKLMEGNIKENPGKSVAIAFTAGLLTSLLFSGRK